MVNLFSEMLTGKSPATTQCSSMAASQKTDSDVDSEDEMDEAYLTLVQDTITKLF